MGRPIQKRLALDLYKKANVLPGPCGLGKISKFQGTLPGYQIIAIHEAHGVSNRKMMLYKNGDHYNVVNPAKLPAFHGKWFFCEKCRSFLYLSFNYRTHPCHTCLHKECMWVPNEKLNCSDCFKICRSVACFEHHKKSRKSKGVDLPSKCESSFKYQTCSVTVERKRQDEHKCGERVCHVWIMCCQIICVICRPSRQRNLTTNLCFTILRRFFPQVAT